MIRQPTPLVPFKTQLPRDTSRPQARWIVAKAVTVLGLLIGCVRTGRRRRVRRFGDRFPVDIVHVGIGVAVAVSIRAAKHRP